MVLAVLDMSNGIHVFALVIILLLLAIILTSMYYDYIDTLKSEKYCQILCKPIDSDICPIYLDDI